MEFRGRAADLGLLAGQLRAVEAGSGTTRGRAVVMTGRRRVGKSRLAQEFCDRSGRPHLVFQATRGRSPGAERAAFGKSLTASALPGLPEDAESRPADWNAALTLLAAAAPDDVPSIAVLDEIPWLMEQDKEFEGALQTVWDRHLSRKPILLILIGSDHGLMESLQSYERPFFGRAAKMNVRPLHLADVRELTGLPSAEAVDALLITGGLPEVVESWDSGMSRRDFLSEALSHPLTPLLASGELSLLGEFPEPSRSRAILRAVGTGERTFTAIATEAGGDGPLPAGTLAPLLASLQEKQVLESDLPLSTKADTKNKRYRIGDTYLRFWLRFLEGAIPFVERGRSDIPIGRIERSWTTWRGRAVEPLIRSSLLTLLPDSGWEETGAVGGWWNRQNNPEIDLVGADAGPVAKRVDFLGSVKWLENETFGWKDLNRLAADARAVPGATGETPLVAVTLNGADPDLPLAAHWGPDDLVRAWRTA
ncbi:ATP-binding protein [Glycomyces xiaoerkulensis]|uniref:ATP-binding protein n=1 Tax=Glycomyces xiaoerkulensis TaxID=2038139 RepID=UPI000C2670A7|nr:AAA family ATPase [Glycomyces xiaoerkulensis]